MTSAASERAGRAVALAAVLMMTAPVVVLSAPAQAGDPSAPAAPVADEKKVVVLRVNFSDYPGTATHSRAEVEGFMSNISDLFFNTSNGHLRVTYEVSDLFGIPGAYADYVDTVSDSSLLGAELPNLIREAVNHAPDSVDFADAAQIAVLFF